MRLHPKAINFIAVVGLILLLPVQSWATTYYVDITGGSDSNNGTSTGTAWKHLRCMPNVTGGSTAATHTPVAGNTYIFKGGETWPNASFPCVWKWNGSVGNVITLGVDATWFTGASWTRPIFTGGGAQMSGARNIFISFFDYTGPNTGASYVTVDNIEFTGFHWSTNYGYGFCVMIFAEQATHITIDHIYVHGWTHAAYPGTGDACVTGVQGDTNPPYHTGSVIQNSVWDGSDSTNGGDMGAVMYAWGGDVKNNVMHDLPNMLLPIHGSEISGNLLYNCRDGIDPGSHENMLETLQGSTANATFYIHDNVFRDANSNCESAFLGNPGETDYVWNNLWYNNPGNPPELTQNVSPGVAVYFWNNTIVPAAGAYCLKPGHSGTYTTIKFQNNHCITTASRVDDPALSATTKVISNNTRQDPSAAALQGYTSSQTPYVYFPGTGGATVGAGTDISENCTGSVAGLCSDTTYGSLVTGTAVTGAGRTAVARGWDTGAYFFVSTTLRQVGPGQTYTTIQACIDAMVPGDVCNVHAGTYTEQLTLASGTAGNLKTIQRNSSDVVIVTNTNSPVITSVNNDYWKLDGLDIRYTGSGAAPKVIYDAYGAARGLANGWTITNCTLTLGGTPTGEGEIVRIDDASNATFTNNVLSVTATTGSHDGMRFINAQTLLVDNNTLTGIASTSGTLQDGLVTDGTDLTITRNTFSDGWSYDDHPDGIVIQGPNCCGNTDRVLIRGNTLTNFTQGIYLDCFTGSCSNIDVFNNVIHETGAFSYGGVSTAMNGIVVHSENVGPITTRIYNNTIDVQQVPFYVSQPVSGNNIDFKNNLLISVDMSILELAGTLTLDYNYYASASCAGSLIRYNGTGGGGWHDLFLCGLCGGNAA